MTAKKKVTTKKPAAKVSKSPPLKAEHQKSKSGKTTAPKKPKTGKVAAKPTRSKIDWEAAKKWFLEDNTRTFQGVADKFGVTRNSVIAHAGPDKGDWRNLRIELAEKAEAELKESLIDEKTKVNNRHLDHWRRIQNIVAKRLTRYENATNEKEATEKGVYLYSGRELKDDTQTMRIAIDGERVVLGLPIIIQHNKNEDLEVPDRLSPEEIERLKADANNRARSRADS